ncbi:MAG: D-alanyl-D-alanine carboxypeptidase family protein [Candidatus Colwellbacteria bacterium]|nr:D-alanyl-D-alanine carboxypeptidase family protein [Candidatus Colwellbacteria bacterium]
MRTKDFPISPIEKQLISVISERLEKEGEGREMEIIDFHSLFKLLNQGEKTVVIKFRDIDPRLYGFKAPYLGKQKIPRNLIAIRNQKYVYKGGSKKIETRYLPKPVYIAYQKLNAALYKDVKRKLLIESGYRSPARQLIVFLYYLNFHKFNFQKVVKRVAIPGYSEHGFPKSQAVDFITTDGIPNDENPREFAKTIEYKWLLKNANRFGFYESYPRNNKLGVTFEPWHWQFRK